jgi:hypothetical protein
MPNIVSFSLWGNNPKYTVGAIRNAELALSVYPQWKLRFYIGESVPNQIIYTLEDFKHVQLVQESTLGDWSSMFWRFKAAFDCDADAVIFRDTDSRLNLREKVAVDQWLESNKTVHIMRDHPHHRFPILGGMWGYRNNGKYDFKNMLETFCKTRARDAYGTDYEFLGQVLKPSLGEDVFVHDPFFDKKDFPTPRENYNFVGQVFDENENTVQEHLQIIKEYMNENR